MVSTLASLDNVDIQQVWHDYKRDSTDKALRNRLIEQYLPLVQYNARRVWARLPDDVEIDDLISAGLFGLVDAIEAFDVSRGVKFETYCVQRIRGAMLDELRANDWVPRLVRNQGSKLTQATTELAARHGRQPTDQELADHMGLSSRELERMIRDGRAVSLTSLNKQTYLTDSDREVGQVDILEDKKGEDPTRRVRRNDLMRLVTKGLNRNERLIIILYYYEELTMKEIGETLGLSESRVSQLHTALVQRIQTQLGERRSEFAA
jgi:RNA polymerase sigma factor for flagellar operon FliA